MNNLLKLYRELKPENNEEAKLAVVLAAAEVSFPLGCKVKVMGTGYIAEVVKYNKNLGGFYPGVRYPVLVKIIRSKDKKFRKAVGMIFEYTPDQLKKIKVKANV